MPFAFQRRDSSPRSPEYTSRASSPSRISPLWKSTRRRILDASRMSQGISVFVGFCVLLLLWHLVTPSTDSEYDRIVIERSPSRNHFQDFEGGLDCRLDSTELYMPPRLDDPSDRESFPYCRNRASLLEALSGGGRHGFDLPYFPRGCHFKWYTAIEICMILDRFDGVVFAGDEIIAHMYAAFNMLMRQNIAFGALEQWRMEDKEIDACRCGKQFTNPDCTPFFATSSETVGRFDQDAQDRSPYACNRVPHFYFPIAGAADTELTRQFEDLLDRDPHSWKPVAIVHGLAHSINYEWEIAAESMDEWLTVADGSGRNTPFLWVGTTAAGDLKAPSKVQQEGNNAMWHYTHTMAHEASRRGVETLNMYNLTVQANSFDGTLYAEKVALVQAMMIVNWLARLETT